MQVEEGVTFCETRQKSRHFVLWSDSLGLSQVKFVNGKWSIKVRNHVYLLREGRSKARTFRQVDVVY